jgi:hypothetical protein
VTALSVKPISEGNGPGFSVQRGKRRFMVWLPRPEVDHGTTVGGAPCISPAREHFAGGWDQDSGNDGDHWRADTLDEVLLPFPGEIEQAFREAIEAVS